MAKSFGISEVVSSGTEWLKLLAKVTFKRLAFSKQVDVVVYPLEKAGMEHSFELAFSKVLLGSSSSVLQV